MATNVIPSSGRATTRSGRRTVGWELPGGVRSLLGTRDSGGLTWLFGLHQPAEALAIVLRRALAVDANEVDQ
jgi:hypothetical protein